LIHQHVKNIFNALVNHESFEYLHKTSHLVIPAKAGIKYLQWLTGLPPARE